MAPQLGGVRGNTGSRSVLRRVVIAAASVCVIASGAGPHLTACHGPRCPFCPAHFLKIGCIRNDCMSARVNHPVASASLAA